MNSFSLIKVTTTLMLWIFLSFEGAIAVTALMPMLDQENVAPPLNFSAAVGNTATIAQTFTVGESGILYRVGLQLRKTSGTSGNEPVLFILPTDTLGRPSTNLGDALYSASIPLSAIPTIDNSFSSVPFTVFDILGPSIHVGPDDTLAIALSRNALGSPPWVLWETSGNQYESGGWWSLRSTSSVSWQDRTDLYDAGFQTFVIPEPTAIIIVCCAAIIFAVGRPRLSVSDVNR